MKCLLIYISLAAILFVSSPASPVRAEEVKSSSTNKITVLPAKFEIWASGGEVLEESLKIVNNDDSDYLYAMSVDPISITGENGEVEIGVANPNLSNLLSSWVETDQRSGTLQAHRTKIITFKISIPEIIDAGGKYASIVISMDKIERATGASNGVAKVVSLMMVTVAGDFAENAKILSFNTARPYGSKEIDFNFRVRNQGANHVKPKGVIVISNIFGRKVDEITADFDNVLPGSTRQLQAVWKPERLLLGSYTATYIANYGQKNDLSMSASKRLSIFPFWPTLLFALAIIAVAWMIVAGAKRYLKKRKHNR